MPVVRSSVDFLQRHFKAECFQHFHRGDADVRFVITHESVIPQNDATASL